MAIPQSLDWLPSALDALDQRHLRRRSVTREPLGGAHCRVAGDKSPLVNFASNDYLGLSTHPEICAAAATVAAEIGVGTGASPVVSGRTSLHAQLETELARLVGCESAMVFSSGFAAGVGVIPALVGGEDAIYSDERNHACLIDGCRLSRATRFIYRHGDTAHLRELLAAGRRFRRRLVVTDTLFSMGGDLAPLADIAHLTDEHQAMLLVDEAHAIGVWGPNGGGVVDELIHTTGPRPVVYDHVSIRMGTLSKALGAAGGFVAGSQLLIDWLTNRARSYVFSTAQPLPVVAAALAAIAINRREPAHRARVIALARSVREQLVAQGWSIGQSTSQIVPVMIGDPATTMACSGRLAEAGFWVPGIRPPTVPEGESQLRISLRADHTQSDIERLLAELRTCRGDFPRVGL